MSRNGVAIIAATLCLFAGMGVSHTVAAVDKAQYEMQERCGRRAAEMFEKEYGTGFETTDSGYIRTTYSNNYNSVFNKCYMRIQNTTHGKEKPGTSPPTFDVISLELRDINANKLIGICIYTKGKPPDPAYCYVAGHTVQSPEDWEVLVEPYME